MITEVKQVFLNPCSATVSAQNYHFTLTVSIILLGSEYCNSWTSNSV